MTQTTLDLAPPARLAPPRPHDRLARALLGHVLGRIRGARLVVRDAEGDRLHGERGAELSAVLHVHDPSAYRDLLLAGSVGAGRSYAEGKWSADDLTALIRILARNRDVLARFRKAAAWMQLPGWWHRLRRRNHRRGSRENIAAHYDLSNEFFGVFLDAQRMYSCAYFETPGSSLEAASIAKLERICRKLRLSPRDHVLEIGAGWGGFAIHAARRYGCRVTTTTISGEQYDYARARVTESGLDDRIRVLRQDYRDLEGTYDKLVSVEMIEAVGPEYLDTFFRVCADRLRPGGRMLLQAITIPDSEYERAARSVDFIKHFIFPGSCIPSEERMHRAVAGYGRLRLAEREDLTSHYARTLARWRERFTDRADTLERLGFDARFRRLWEFYFAYCEGGFSERRIGTVHWVLDRGDAR